MTSDTVARHRTASEHHFARAERLIPQGVNSFNRVRRNKIAFDRGSGSRLWDVDGNEYVDTVLAFGPLLFGHGEPAVNEAVMAQLSRLGLAGGGSTLEADLAERACDWIPCAEQVLFSVTGSEAVRGALRIARATTGRSLVVKFEGHYHGWLDPMYANANGAVTGDVGSARYALRPNCGGQFTSDDMLAVTRFHDKDAFDALMSEVGHRVAAVILEPIPFNFGAYLPDVDYLTHLRDVTKRYGSMLIFDEVVSGFRVARGGAQSLFGVTPDLATFAKAMASGFPISMIAGSRDAMGSVTSGAVKHAGTYNAAPASLAASLATIGVIAESEGDVYSTLDALGGRLQRGIDAIAARRAVPLQLNRVGSVSQLFWGAEGSRRSYESCCTSDGATVAAIAETAAEHGVHVAPRGLMFLGTRHTADDVDRIVSAVDASVAAVLAGER